VEPKVVLNVGDNIIIPYGAGAAKIVEIEQEPKYLVEFPNKTRVWYSREQLVEDKEEF
jgi:hypothetical protein